MRRIFLCERHFLSPCVALLLISLSLLLLTCSPILKRNTPEVPGPKSPSVEDIFVEFDPPSGVVAWGETLAVQIEAGLTSGQKYPVYVRASQGPPGFSVWLDSPILAPDQNGKLILSPALGEAELGHTEIHLEAGAFGMREPREFRYSVEIVRQSGQFVEILTGLVNQDCRAVCGRITSSAGEYRVDFYDVMPEQGQSCDDAKSLPITQRINRSPYATTEEGFGFGRTCRVALVVSPGGDYKLVNLRMPGAKVGRGEVLARLRNIQDLLLSRDNTVALVVSGGSLVPYDVLTGQVLGDACRGAGSFAGATLTDGKMLTATGDRLCTWVIQ